MRYYLEVPVSGISCDARTEKANFWTMKVIKNAIRPETGTSNWYPNLLSVFYGPLPSELSRHIFCVLPILTTVLVENIPEPTTEHELFGSIPRPRGSYLKHLVGTFR
jgi:hypothetical protein